MAKKVAVLGSTGSIGTNALEVISAHEGDFITWGLSANRNWRLLAEQARRHKAQYVAVADARSASELAQNAPELAGRIISCDELAEAGAREADIIVIAVVGAAGLRPALAAVRSGKRVALANKECLVMAGGLLMAEARLSGAEVIPVDSEHSALFQAMRAGDSREVTKAVITASGGPFLDRPAEQFDRLTVNEALAHPTWSMGKKITIDSATMANKAFEIIEARWLFDLQPAKIGVLVHPESIVHALVEFADGSVIAQMSIPDMRLPIQYALTYPERLPSQTAPLDLGALGGLTFREPDTQKFPCLTVGFEVAREGATTGAVFNAANEVAVEAFLESAIGFPRIYSVIRRVLDNHKKREATDLETVLEADRWARAEARKWL